MEPIVESTDILPRNILVSSVFHYKEPDLKECKYTNAGQPATLLPCKPEQSEN